MASKSSSQIPKVTNELENPNRFPDCVFVKLHKPSFDPDKKISSVILLPHSTESHAPGTAEADLKLTIRFGQQEVEVPGGKVWFGLKRGELKLRLENGQIPIEKQELTAKLENEIEFEIHQEKGRELEGSTSLDIKTGLIAKTKGINKTSTKANFKTYSIFTRGTEEQPIWVFEVNKYQPVLQGQLNEVTLGLVNMFAKPCCIEAVFEIRGQQDISLTEADGLWSKDIGRNKLAILERELFLRFIAPKLKPYLSRVEVQYE